MLFDCCGERCHGLFKQVATCKCPVRPDSTTPAADFYLRYKVNLTRDVASIQPANTGVITTPECDTFYNVLRDNKNKETVSSTEFTLPSNMQVHLAIGHQHTGALNISLFVNNAFLCASFPRHGVTLGVPGDEKGYLVAMTRCYDQAITGTPLQLNKGDRVRLDSWYYVGDDDSRLWPGASGTHLNVMGYMFIAYTGNLDGELHKRAVPLEEVLSTMPPLPACTQALQRLRHTLRRAANYVFATIWS